MFTDFLKPVSNELQDFSKSCNSFCLGTSVNFDKELFLNEDFKNKDKIAIIGVQEFRSKNTDEQLDVDFDILRRTLYELKKGNWNLPIFDFGDLIPTGKKEDLGIYFSKVLNELYKEKFFVIVLGGCPSLGFYQYRSFDEYISNINYFIIDEKLRFGNEIHQANEDNYLTKIISSEPLNLLDFTNLGYQTYFVAQEELDLINHLNFEAIRLGELNQEIKEVEPFVREANAGLINLSAIESNYFSSTKDLSPNGFNSREICAIAKYIGSSYVLSSVYVSNYIEKYIKSDHLLASQLIWYLIEGRNHRPERKKIDDAQYFEKFYVPSDMNNFIFYRNIETNQWWIEILEDNNVKKIVPCSEKDYEKALKGDVPTKWWKYFKKFY